MAQNILIISLFALVFLCVRAVRGKRIIIIKFRHWPEHDFNSEQLFASLLMGDAMNITFYDLMRLWG